MTRVALSMIVALGAAWAAPGCLGSDTVTCPWGTTCPAGSTCYEPTEECVLAAQVEACQGVPEGEGCSFAGSSPDYVCRNRLCVEPYCGDGFQDPGEACDDGASNSDTAPDACRMDCLPPRCGDAVQDAGEQCDTGGDSPFCNQQCERIATIDLLIVMDNTDDMETVLALMRLAVPQFMTQLWDTLGYVPSLHLGVTTTDLGTFGFSATGCADVDGDWGRLLPGSCPDLGGLRYVVDALPQGCAVQKTEEGDCPDHDCDESHCAQEPATRLVTDASGCPRCRNYPEDSLNDAMFCVTALEAGGCRYPQPLEAMYKALDDHPDNVGFLREHSYLIVLIVSDKDDCSASNPTLFDPAAEADLGPLTPFRCFAQGVVCDPDDAALPGTHQSCAPREDSALMYPVRRYVQLFEALRQPGMRLVGVIAGPVDDGQVSVGRDLIDRPLVEPSCETLDLAAKPGVRLRSFAAQLNLPEEMSWAYHSICSPDRQAFFDGLTERMIRDLGQLE